MSQQNQKQKNRKIELLEEIRDLLKEQKSLDNKDEYKDKVYLDCGWEYDCKPRDCPDCQRVQKYTLDLTFAEESVIEDFAFCDIEAMIKEHPEQFDLMQKIMIKLFNKLMDAESRGLK